jgi:GAF domain-containing protein
MGDQGFRFFQEAERLGGIPAKVRLASLARITSTEARAREDDPDMLGRLHAALERIRYELDGRTSIVPEPEPSEHDPKLVVRLRRHIETFVDLMSQRALVIGNLVDSARRIDEAAAAALGVARVSVWLLDDARTKITCLDLFEARTSTHSTGLELFAKDYPSYFAALDTERTISAGNAVTDPRTACFAATYLKPLGIGAMLDVPIWARGRMVGVVCHEHLGGVRTWDADEERFAYLMSSFIAMAMERGRPPLASTPG